MIRSIQNCQCRFAKEFGFDVQRWIGGKKSWQPVGTPKTLVEMQEMIEAEKRVLIRCSGCGNDLLREYE